MTYLSQSEIEELDKTIDRRIESFPLLQRNRDSALFSVLIIFDDWIDRLGAELNLAKRGNAYRSAYDSLDYCVQWINLHCPRSIVPGELSTTDEELVEASNLFKEGRVYAKVWTQISLLRRGRTRAEIVSENSYRLSPVSLSDKNRDTGRMLIPGGADPDSAKEAETLTPSTRQRIWGKIRKLKLKRQLQYSIRPQIVDEVERVIAHRSLLDWHMDPSWDLGGYTLADLKKFWISLQAIQAIHSVALEGAKLQNSGQNPATTLSWRMMRKTHREWVTRLFRRCGLSFSTTEKILLDLTYDEKMYGPGKPNPHVMFTPFFTFDNGLVGLSSKIVQISNIERNIWANVHRRRQNIIDKLKDEKEKFWTQQITEELNDRGFLCIPRIPFTFDGVPRNLDLLILSPGEQFGLICELKWITGSDDVKAVVSMDKEITKGVQQVRISQRWLRSNLLAISEITGIPEGDLKDYTFESIVLTKEGQPSGFVEKPTVPVVTESLMKWVLLKPHQLGLKRLWHLANSLEYLPKEGVHFRNVSPTVEWGGLKFQLENLAFEGLERWRPSKDIN